MSRPIIDAFKARPVYQMKIEQAYDGRRCRNEAVVYRPTASHVVRHVEKRRYAGLLRRHSYEACRR